MKTLTMRPQNSPSAGMEKLQKVLANLGLGSRRHIEEWISAGRILVDGKVAQLGLRVRPTAKITVDGKPVRQDRHGEDRTHILLYHKPEGEISTREDPQGRPTVFANLPELHRQRWIQVGRLDLNTSGLLIFTTNGALAHYLMHPSKEIEREYAVRILGEVSKETIDALLHGVTLEDGTGKFTRITDAGGTGVNHWYHVIIKEGRQREVRRLWESQGVRVSRLIRIRYASLKLPRTVRPGRFVELTKKEAEAFMISCGFMAPPRKLEKIKQGTKVRANKLK